MGQSGQYDPAARVARLLVADPQMVSRDQFDQKTLVRTQTLVKTLTKTPYRKKVFANIAQKDSSRCAIPSIARHARARV